MTISYRFKNGYTLSDEVPNFDGIAAFSDYINQINECLHWDAEQSAAKAAQPKPASEKQKATMIKFRIPFDDGITSEEASRRIEESIKGFKRN